MAVTNSFHADLTLCPEHRCAGDIWIWFMRYSVWHKNFFQILINKVRNWNFHVFS